MNAQDDKPSYFQKVSWENSRTDRDARRRFQVDRHHFIKGYQENINHSFGPLMGEIEAYFVKVDKRRGDAAA